MNEDTLSLLRVEVRNVIYKKGWTALRQIQNGVIRAFFASKKDILGIGPTGCGKTEAIYLPTFSAMLDAPLPSIRLVCVSPLKSLINDQFLRLRVRAKTNSDFPLGKECSY